MYSFRLPINKTKLQRLIAIQTGKFEPNDRTSIAEARIVMNVRCMACLFRSAGDLEDSAVEVRHLDLRHSIRRRIIPSIPDGFSEIAFFIAVESVAEYESAVLLKPCSIIRLNPARNQK